MAQTIDERIVEMRIDNEQFERAANTMLWTLAKLREASDFNDLESSLKGINVDFLGDAFEHLADRIDKSVNGIWSTVRRKIGEGVTEELKKLGKVIEDMSSLGQLDEGFGKFGDKTKSVATLTAQGYELEKVNDLMEQLNWFTDETSYNFTEMVSNIAKFTATGQDLDKSVTAMEGIALWAAASGQGAQKASQAMYQLSQAMGKGALKYDDYKSIQNASMDTKEFREQAVKAAEALGVLKKVGEDTWQTLGTNAKAEKEVLEANKKLYQARKDLDYALARQANATTESSAMSAARAVEKAQEKIADLQEKVKEAEAELKNGFSLSELFSSDALSRNQWFTSDVMMEVFNQYSKAVSEIQRYMVDNDLDTASEAMRKLEDEAKHLAETTGTTLDEAFKKLGYDIDEFSLKAFKAGQEARSWGDVVESVKDAVSTGWMKTFELIFGQADKAIEFWSDIAERFYNIFAEGGNIRNDVFKIAFGTGEAIEESGKKAEQSISGWTRFENTIKDSGLTMEDFEKSCRKVIDSSDNLALDHIIDEYGSLREAFEQGAISGNQFKEILDDLQQSTGQNLGAMTEDVEKVGHSFEELKEVAMGIIRGDFGNGAERRQILEELGYNYDLVQAMAEIIYNGGQGYVGLTEELLKNEYPTYYEMLVREMQAAGEAVQDTNSMLADSDAILQDIRENTLDLTGDVKKDIDVITGSDLFKGSLTNLLQIIESIQEAYRGAVDDAFGSIEERGARIYQILKQINKFTEDIQPSENTLNTIQNALKNVLTWLGNILTILGELGKAVGDALGLLTTVGTAAATALDRFFKGAFGRGYTDFLRGTGDTTEKIIGIIESARKEIQNLGNAIKERLPEIELLFYRAGRTVRPALSAIVDVLRELWPLLKEVLSTLKTLAGIGLDWLGSLIKGFFGKDFSDGVKNASESISGKLVKALQDAQKWLKEFSDSIKENVPNAEEKLYRIGASIRVLANNVLEALPLVRQGVSLTITKILDYIGGFIPSLQPYTDSISDWLRNMFGTAAEDGEKYLPEFSSLFEKFKELANNAFNGILEQLGYEDLDAVNADLEQRFGNLWTTITSWWEKITQFFSNLSFGDNQNGIFDSLKSIFKDFDSTEVLSHLGKSSAFILDDMFPTDEEIDGKTENFWNRLASGLANKFDISSMFPSEDDIEGETNNFIVKLYKGIRSAFDKIQWGQAFTIVKAATFASILFNVNRFFNNLKVSVDPQRNGFLGLIDSIKKPFQNFSGLLFELSKSVKKNAEGDQWIKLSVAIGILAASLLALSVIDEQTLFNVAAVLAGLMMLLKWIAASGNGLQIFSNNIKQVTKDVDSSTKIFDKLNFQDLKLKALFEDITLTGNVIPPAMGALIGIGVCIAAIGAVLIKLKDLKSFEEVLPALGVIGAIFGGIIVTLGILSVFSSKMKGLGGVLIGMSLSFTIIASSVKSLMKLQVDMQSLGSIAVGLIAGIGTFGLLIFALGMAMEKMDSPFLNSGKLMAFAAVLLSMGLAFGLIAGALRSMATADAGDMLAAGLALTLVAAGLAAIIFAFSKVPAESSMMKASASILVLALALTAMLVPISVISLMDFTSVSLAMLQLGVFTAVLALIIALLSGLPNPDAATKATAALLIMSVAIGVLSLAIGHLADLDVTGIGAATLALISFTAVLTLLIAALSKMDSGKILSTSVALITASTAVGVLALAIAGLAVGFGVLVWTVPWDEFGVKAQAMAAAIAPLEPAIAILGIAIVVLIGVLATVGDRLLKAGIGFAGVGAGVYLVVEALSHLPEAIEGIVKSIELIKEHAWTLVEFAALIFGAVIAVLALKESEFITRIISFGTKMANALASSQVLTQFGNAILKIGGWLLALITVSLPGLTEKLIVLLIGLISGLADAINAHASEIASAVEKAVIALLNVILQTFIRLFFDAIGGIAELINKALKFFGVDLMGDGFNFFEYWHADATALSDDIDSSLKTVFNIADDIVKDRSEQTSELLTSTLADGVESGSGEVVDAVEGVVDDASGAAESKLTDAKELIIGWSKDVGIEFGDSGSLAGFNFGNNFSDAVGSTNLMDGLSQVFNQFTSDSEANGEDASEATWSAWASANDVQIPLSFNQITDLMSGMDGFGGLEGLMTTGGTDMADWTWDAYGNALPEDVQAAMQTTSTELDNANRNLESDYKVVGEFGAEKVSTGYQEEIKYRVFDMVADTINGLNYEMVDAREYLVELGRYIGRNVREGYEEEFDINSPSKVMAEEMAYTIEGLVVGAKKQGHRAFDAMSDVGDGMADAMRNSMSMLALAVDRDYDLQPRITPVVDLGPASRGASALRSMMQGGTLATALEGYNSLAGLNVSGAVLNYTNQNAPVTSAINDLSKRMDDLGRTLDNDRNFNVGIRVDKMAVRSEEDITAISKQLAKEVRVALRQKPTR